MLLYSQKSQVTLFSPWPFDSQAWENKKHHEMTFPETDSPLLPQCHNRKKESELSSSKQRFYSWSPIVKAILQLLNEVPLCPKWTQNVAHKLMLENRVRFGQWNLFDSAWDWRGPRTRNQKAALLGLQNLRCNLARLNIKALHHATHYEKASTCIHKSTWRTAFSLGASLDVNLQSSGTHIWSEYRKARGWRRLLLSPRVDGIVLLPSSLPLPGNAARKMKAMKQQGSGKNSIQIQSLCCQTSADIVFVFRGKLMREENFNFPLAIIFHWRKSYLQLSSWCITVLLPEMQFVLLYWSSPDLIRCDTRNTCTVNNPQLSVIKNEACIIHALSCQINVIALSCLFIWQFFLTLDIEKMFKKKQSEKHATEVRLSLK